jgi:hypothetical protein
LHDVRGTRGNTAAGGGGNISITPVPPEARDEMHRLLAQAPTIIGRVAHGDTDGISDRELG